MVDPNTIREKLEKQGITKVKEKLRLGLYAGEKKKIAEAWVEEHKDNEVRERHEEQINRQDTIDKDARRTAKHSKNIAIIALSVSVLSALATIYYAQKNFELAEWSMKVSEIAYIDLKGMSLVHLDVGIPIEAVVEFNNTGKTRARKVETDNTIWLGTEPLPKNPRYGVSLELGSEAIFPPGIPFSAHIKSQKLVTQEVIDSIKQGKAMVYVYGRVDYEDIFGQPHFLKYCGLYNPAKKKFDVCPYHNEAD